MSALFVGAPVRPPPLQWMPCSLPKPDYEGCSLSGFKMISREILFEFHLA